MLKTTKKNHSSTEARILQKLIPFFLTIFILSILYSMNPNLTNVPELDYYNNQTLKLLAPKKDCDCEKTLFFSSNLRNKPVEINKDIYDIIQYKNRKNFFVTYYMGDEEYEQYENLLAQHEIIKSINALGDSNFYLGKRCINLIKKNRNLMKLNNFKKFYRFFGYQILMKDTLYQSYRNMKEEFNEDYNYMAETYYYPHDKKIIKEKFRKYELNMNDLWLVKPAHSFGGYGIRIFESLKDIKAKNYLLTKYISNLDLINNKKYDLRLYVLVTGLRPLRIYFNQEGLIRIAAQNFTLNEEFIKNRYVHLTNTGVNSISKDFIVPDNSSNEEANIWNLKMWAKHLKQLNVDYNEVKSKISDIIIKSIISVYQNLTLLQRENNLNDINFYDLLGYDIIISKNFEPTLLEINSGPSIVYHNQLDKPIKTNLLVDTLNLLGIKIYNKNNIFHKQKEKKISAEENIKNALCELSRPRGDYQLIFPLKENINKYKKFFKGRNTKENKLFWKIIQND